MRCSLLFVCAALFPSLASASTYLVTPDGTGDFPAIQAAVNAAGPGDVIELADGVFTGNGNRDVDYFGKAITIRSRGGDPGACVIDCMGSESDPHRGFLFQSDEGPGSILEGVTIRNGWGVEIGGAVLSLAYPHIRNCVFRDNQASTMGGAIYFGGFSERPIHVRDCRFFGNRAIQGGAVSVCYGTATISGCTFAGNFGEEGGGLSV
jgi:predicted outer membrane repeat protein